MKPCQGFHKEFLHKERSAPVDEGLDAHGRHAVVDAYAHERSHETSFCVTLSAKFANLASENVTAYPPLLS